MDLTSPTLTTNSPLTPVFGNNVQDLLGVGLLYVNPSSIITVNSIADQVDDFNSGVTTLRDAINQANADAGSDLIVFDRSVFASAQTITLSLGELDITHNLSIIAPRDPLTGADLVTVSGNKASRVFEIEPGATVTLSGLIEADGLVPFDQVAFQNGHVAIDNGGGIKNSGILTLDSCIVSNNSISNPTENIPVSGGGIYNTGTLEVSNSTIRGNGAAEGGGIYNQGTLTVSNSTLSSNLASQRFGAGGAGIYNQGQALVLNSTMIDNSIFSDGGEGGGGILNTGNLQVINSTLNNNSAGAAFSNGGGILNIGMGTLEISNSTLSGNSALESGGGISNLGGNSIIKNSTFSGNSAPFGGGISNVGTMTVTNSTLSGNSASHNNNPFSARNNIGGGIYNDGTLTLVFSTLTLNSAANGSGVYNDPGSVGSIMIPSGTVNVRNTIIAGNINSTDSVNPDVSGSFTSNGYNLIGDSTSSTGFGSPGDIVGTSDNPIDPRLAPLDFYGGPTQTIALLQDSPAIDAGDPTVLDTDPTTDQRGLDRVSNGRADIGAFEVQV